MVTKTKEKKRTQVQALNPDAATATASAPALDLSYLNSSVLLTWQQYKHIQILLVGCGGSGSWVAPHLVRITRELMRQNKAVELSFVDPDVVEEKNCIRQNFCLGEVGLLKARTLAFRYSAAWNVPIAAIVEPFNSSLVSSDRDTMTIIVGCVDNAEARREIHAALLQNLTKSGYYSPGDFVAGRQGGINRAQIDLKNNPIKVWWLDCGNAAESGQVLLGCLHDAMLKNMGIATEQLFNLSGICPALPSPAIQIPDLLVARPYELTSIEYASSNANLSCEDLVALNFQSLMVNQRIAAEAGDYLVRLLLTKDLRRFQTFFDLASGVSRSTYITPQAVKPICERFLASIADLENLLSAARSSDHEN